MLNWRSLVILVFLTSTLPNADAAGVRIKKVLSHYLDRQGRHTLAPSLFERDAYQAQLRQNPRDRSAMRFDVNWKAIGLSGSHLKLQLELRGSKGNPAQPLVLETLVKAPALFSKWSALTLTGGTYEELGDLIAWRASLWNGEKLLAEQKSFLW